MPSDSQQVDQTTIHLDPDQAIVLFDYLSEVTSVDNNSERTAEFSVFAEVLSQLEKQLVAPFREDYSALLAEAKDRLSQTR